MKNRTIKVESVEIILRSQNNEDFISLTDMARYRDSERTNYIIQNWLRTRNAIEFCGLWEQLNNPNFKGIEFDAFKIEAGSNSFTLTPQKWIEATNAIGMISKSGRYGGTFAHRDIAFEFASWISPQFKLYLITEFQRLKADENDRLKLEWNFQRTLAKVNYLDCPSFVTRGFLFSVFDASFSGVKQTEEFEISWDSPTTSDG